ncbi:MAG: ATP-dependent RNA helicase [Treponema sp.]|jgi:HrpA-like RNA helicase|nr:ATP-dependent RNA helicase [Treponema sp.]
MNYLDLPVYKHKDRILSALASDQVIVVESPTGSGKTTQLPVILYEAGYAANGIIGVTQPRRIAALSVSEFIARQTSAAMSGDDHPAIVGYKMRFEDKTDSSTKIKIMTDGILLQEMKLDPCLSRYRCIIIDEAHERSLNIDFILGLMKRVLEVRPEFKVIVSSATINAQIFSEYFGECPVVKIDAVSYPVQVIYEPLPAPQSAYKREFPREKRGAQNPRYFATPQDVRNVHRAAADALSDAMLAKIMSIIDRIIDEGRKGDALIFLSGEKIIKDCMAQLYNAPFASKLHIVPLYGRLSKEEQERVFETAPAGKIKVVIATNIAETSVTIDGITSVIDSGFSKLNFYNPNTYTSSLVEGPVSKASANQRKGRAGRTQEGVCYRLYSPKDFERRPLFTTEEIYRTDLSEVVLRMSDLGITEFEEFDFISPPVHEGVIAAIETLNLLDAIEADRTLSKIGKMMTEFPLSPRQSRIIVEAILKHPKVIEETVIAAAFLSTQSPYVLPPGEEFEARHAHHRFRDPNGDFVSYLKLYREYLNAAPGGGRIRFCEKNYIDPKTMAEIVNIVEQLGEIVSDMDVPLLNGGSIEDYLCCVARGMIQFVCVRDGWDSETYSSLTEDGIIIHPGSVMFKSEPKYIVAGEIVKTSRMYAMSVSPLSPATLMRISEKLFVALGGDASTLKKQRKGRRKQAAEFRQDAAAAQNVQRAPRLTIGSEVFEIKLIKKRQTVILQWEKIAKIKDAIKNMNLKPFKKIRGILVLKDGWTICPNERLDRILSLIPFIDIDDDVINMAAARTCPDKTYNSREQLPDLLVSFPLLAFLCPIRHGKAKTLGFISLNTDHNGNYWFSCQKNFSACVNKSLVSLEDLIDELDETVDIGVKAVINETYRRTSVSSFA